VKQGIIVSEDEFENLDDIRREESSRGRKQPKSAVSLARERMVRSLNRLLSDPACERSKFFAAIRAYGLKDESEEFRKLAELWKKVRGNG